jgi:hypothetical protein
MTAHCHVALARRANSLFGQFILKVVNDFPDVLSKPLPSQS